MNGGIIPAVSGTMFIFAMTVLGSAAVFLVPEKTTRRCQWSINGFIGGIMTAAALWSLILPSIERAGAIGGLPVWLPAASGIITGSLFISSADFLNMRHDADGGSRFFTAITLHNIPEGMAVGLAFALACDGESFCAAAALATGIGVQNIPEGAAVSLPLIQCGMGKTTAFMRGVLSGAVEPLSGMLAVLTATAAVKLMPWLLGFSAGAMLYVTVSELSAEDNGRAGSLSYIGGFVLMMILDVALG